MAVPRPIQTEDKKTAICRICLIYDECKIGKGLSLYEKHDETLICDKINYIANIEVREGDGLPDRICGDCLLSLENACIFKEKCENSDAILQASLHQEQLLQDQSLEVPIKCEIPDECEYEYLDENVSCRTSLQESEEVEPKADNIKPNPTKIPFKSRAIDLKLECHDCGGSFKSKCKLQVHWKKVHLPAQLVCPNCKKTCKSYKAFHSHIKRNSKSCRNASKLRIEGEGRSRVFHCIECSYNSKRLQSMITHLVTHTGERPFKCDMCSKSYTQHSSLFSHKEHAHKVYVKEGTCHHCGKHLKGRNRLYKHMKSHINTEVQCTVCSKTLQSKSSLQQHMKRHSGVKAYTCEICAKTFYTIGDLINHKTKIHEKNRFYTCDICGYKTLNCSSLTKHRPKHSSHNVACNVCGKFLENEQQLMLHKKRHFERNLCCLYCDKKFYARKTLTSHLRKIHKVYAVIGGRSAKDRETNNADKLDVKVENDKLDSQSI